MKKEMASDEELPGDESPQDIETSAFKGQLPRALNPARRQTIIICAILFLLALGCRLLSWQDNRFEGLKVQTAVTQGYKHTALLLHEGGIGAFFSSGSPLSDPNHLGHPPGYSVIIALVYEVFGSFGEANTALQLIQILADASAAIVVLFIALALLDRTIATIAALLVAVAPQFTYNSVLLLPDTLTVLPILLSVLVLIHACRRPRLVTFLFAGALIGLACWLRANALLLPIFMTAVIPIVLPRGNRRRYALGIVAGAVLVIAPLTIRNYIVYDHFIPVSLGAGQTLLEGIADYDEDRTLGIPNTDMGIMKWEAEIYQRPDYFGTLFNPDGVKRERQRLARGFGVIRSHPFWFFSVMLRRGASMLRLERVRIVSADPPVKRRNTDVLFPSDSISPQDLLANADPGSSARALSLTSDKELLRIQGDDSTAPVTSPPIFLAAQTEYILMLPVRIEEGRVRIRVVGVRDQHEYASTIVEAQDWKSSSDQPLNVLKIAFVNSNEPQARLIFENAGATGVKPVLEIGKIEIYAMGPASFTWTRFPRAIVRLIQRLFVTAVMLPLALIGIGLLIIKRQFRTIAVLLIVPAYYLCVQSALHTEYRYVLAIHYFLFVLVAVAIHQASEYLWSAATRRRFQKR